MNRREVNSIRKNRAPSKKIATNAFRKAAVLAVAGIFSASIGGCAALPKKMQVASSESVTVEVPKPKSEPTEGKRAQEKKKKTKVGLVGENPYVGEEEEYESPLMDCPY
ncbi:hypothetical protein GF412_05505 [Candidatus Micrarchaeota archaeon]|nr:hypothetical protein [Candidatus Micrarchaeota archaeon]MBD3418408.1 hypothetical protein [Candidatus Micrarchaeota archaeon]